MYDTLEYLEENGIGLLTLSRPQCLNAINATMASEIETLMAALSRSDTLRALVVSGSERIFCAGADIAALGTLVGTDGAYRFLAQLQNALNAIEALPVPSIAALEGSAFGGGCELAIACDFRIMAETAVLGVPEIKLGLLPGAGGTQRLARLLPVALAKQMICLGEPLDAASALRHGLVNAVVPATEVMAESRRWAARLAALAPLALRAAKTLVHGAALGGLVNGIDAERQAVAYLFQTDDAHEGIRAFLDKRPATFTGA
jgi:enoyl-CoA hydratase